MHWVLIIFLIVALLFLSIYTAIVLFGRRQQSENADIICTFGAAVWGNVPSPELAARISWARHLQQQGRSRLLFLSGGSTGGPLSEPDVMAATAVSEGSPRESLVLDINGTSTSHTLQNLKQYMQDNKLTTCLMVSSPFHMARIMVLARLYGIKAYSCPPDETPLTLDPSNNMRAVLREEFALFKDVLVFLLSRDT